MGHNGVMEMMAQQLGLAMIPRWPRRASGLISGTTSGTCGSRRNAEELSMTVAPARPSSTTPPHSAWTRRCRWWCRRSTRRLSAAIVGSSPTPTAAPSSPSPRCGPFIASIASAGCSSRPIRPHRARVLPHPYAFNLFSHNTRIDPATGYNDEETKVIQETRKIFGDGEIRVSATCVRVPVLRAHSMAITFECSQPITPARVRELLREAPGVKLVDDAERNYFPMPKDASGQDAILVGRIRNDISDPDGRSISLFVAGDQLLKGAALNAVQIAEALRTG